MYIRINTGVFDASRAQEVQELVERSIVPALRKMPGFTSHTTSMDRQGNRLVAITAWETEAQARGLRDQLGSDIMQQIQDAGVKFDDPQIFETVIQS